MHYSCVCLRACEHKLKKRRNTFCYRQIETRKNTQTTSTFAVIFFFSISINVADPSGGAATSHPKGQTPKQRLMQWIKARLPAGIPLTNFTTDWNDGMALGALVNALAPGACDDWRSWRPDDALANTRRAMSAAEQCLGVGKASWRLLPDRSALICKLFSL